MSPKDANDYVQKAIDRQKEEALAGANYEYGINPQYAMIGIMVTCFMILMLYSIWAGFQPETRRYSPNAKFLIPEKGGAL